MSQVVSDPAASNEDSKVFAHYMNHDYRLTLRTATRRVWITCDFVGLFRCVFHTCAWSRVSRRTLVMRGLLLTLTCWHMQGEYIFTLTQLIVVDCVRVISALQTQRKVSHYCSNIPTTHPFLSIMQKWSLLQPKMLILTKHTVFQSIKREQYSIWGVPWLI